MSDRRGVRILAWRDRARRGFPDYGPGDELKKRPGKIEPPCRRGGRWTYRDWLQWHFLWKFFPWYAREMRYRGHFCLGQGCMHWFWENAEKKERGYCSAAVSRTQNMMWAEELGDRIPRQLAAPPAAAGNVSKFPSRRP